MLPQTIDVEEELLLSLAHDENRQNISYYQKDATFFLGPTYDGNMYISYCVLSLFL